MLELLIEHPLLLQNQKDTVQLSFRKDALYSKMIMLAVRLPGLDSKVLDYQMTIKVSFCLHRDKQPEQGMSHYEGGNDFVLKGQDNPNYPTVNSVLEFLMELYNQGSKYSAICVASSTLATVQPRVKF